MFSINSIVPRGLHSAVLAAAGFTFFSCGFSTAALAQDCKLGVVASPQILSAGQSAQVNVFAHFPPPDVAPPALGAYAFASSQFDVYSSHPMWTAVSSGAIVGDDVLGMNVSQPHMPWAGIFADPTNPYRVWSGTFKPTVGGAPALVQFAADPMTFWVYPSELTSSSVPREAEVGIDWLFVNPLKVGSWVAAPGAGTTVRVHDDVVVDGRVITAENPSGGDDAAILVGMLHPAIQKIRASSTRVEFVGQPHTFTVTIQHDSIPAAPSSTRLFYIDLHGVSAAAAQRSMVTNLTVTFSGLEGPNGEHSGGMNVCMGDSSVRGLYGAFLGGVYVASGDMNGDGDEGGPGLIVESLPQTIGAKVGMGTLVLSSANTYGGLTQVFEYAQPVMATARDSNGHSHTVMLDRIEVYAPIETAQPTSASVSDAARWARSANNLRQIGLGAHIFEATGASSMTIAPLQPR